MLTVREHCGKHLIVEVWTDIDNPVLTDENVIRKAFLQGAADSQATVIGHNWHSFGPGEGITGVVMLSESHMSVHTWPEHGYASVDVYMCGDCDPHLSVPAISNGLNAKRTEVTTLLRGVLTQKITIDK